MKAYNVCHWSLYLDGLIHTWKASRSTLGCLQKTGFCFKYINWTSLQIKSKMLIYTKAILMICLQIWSWTSWSRIQIVQFDFWHEIWNHDRNKPIIKNTWRHIMIVIGFYSWTAWSIPGWPDHTWTAWSMPGRASKDKILFLISKFNFITEKIQQVEIHKGNF